MVEVLEHVSLIVSLAALSVSLTALWVALSK